ncbi:MULTISPECIES: MFS transporter [Acinetobacter]|uniref:MFS transporter n=1 Tax=Acinetobacter TaxID=469 RepID=UPI00029E9344|nr:MULTISPECIES: MFS transporter [Acinetobacter]EKU55001.1 transporter, major facilitator family protein [Acinetobacter sp. WC-323]MCU4368791.1 MFS transporter [Acinetobacter courvalinii]MCU4446995.1 MFS transporter [Acinetobacter courvalinii]MCU4640558.1 MFS transporter [Acinetobacter courvalinii]
MDKNPRYLETPPDWSADERPTLPGSPAAIAHARPKRFAYFVIGLLICIAASLSNGFIVANLPIFQGEYGLTASQAAWLPAAYVMANVSSNLILFKARQQYGLRLFSEIGLLVFIGVLILHIFVKTYEMALFVRFIAGLAAAPLSSLGMYYTMQAFGKADMAKGIYLAFGFQQLGLPLAWIISPFLLSANQWDVIYTFELGLAICCFAMVVSLKLPRSLRLEVFEKQDFFTFALLAPGFACLCIVLTQGPILWWFDSPWLAYTLIVGFCLIVLGLTYEHYRTNPLIMTRWLAAGDLLSFVVSAFALRLLMSEQSYAAVNFLKTMGMGPDQFVPLYVVIFCGTIAGSVFSALTFHRERLILNLFLAEILILIACALDYHLTSDVRPANFYRSQFLVSFAGGVFIGPLLLMGFMRTLQRGPQYVVTFIVLFSATQNFGGLVGSSFFNTYQQHHTYDYKVEINSNLDPTDPLVAQRLQAYQRSAMVSTNDPVLQNNQALQNLNKVVTREAQVRAYNDVIVLNGIFAVVLLLWGLFKYVRNKYMTRKNLQAAS